MEAIEALLWVAFAVSFLYSLQRLCRPASPGAQWPPGPAPLPVLGNLLDLRGELHHTLARLAAKHGPVMTVRLGLTPAVIISTHEAAQEALGKQERHFAARTAPDAVKALSHHEYSMIWLPSTHPLWKTIRGICATHLFSPRGLDAMSRTRERKVRDLVDHFRRCSGKPVDIGYSVYGGVLNMVSNMLFSVDLIDLNPGKAQEFRYHIAAIIVGITAPNVSDMFPLLRLLDLQGWRRGTERHIKWVFGVFDGITKRRIADAGGAEEKEDGDFLDVLIPYLSTDKLTHHNIRVILFDILAAATDAVSFTVEWTMAELLANPSVLAKLRAEIKDAVGTKETLEESDVAKMAYLHAVVKETMRVKCPSPLLLPHQVADDGVTIGGYDIPRGTLVLFNSWAIMRDPEVWAKPDVFMPERFLERPEIDYRVKEFFEFLPFGAGRRSCPGMPMAARVVPLIVASLVHKFQWQLPNGMAAEDLDLGECFKTANNMTTPLRAIPVVAA